MAQPIEEKWHQEETEVKALLETALNAVKIAMKSQFWAYTREYQLGKLAVAQAILFEILEEFKP